MTCCRSSSQTRSRACSNVADMDVAANGVLKAWASAAVLGLLDDLASAEAEATSTFLVALAE